MTAGQPGRRAVAASACRVRPGWRHAGAAGCDGGVQLCCRLRCRTSGGCLSSVELCIVETAFHLCSAVSAVAHALLSLLACVGCACALNAFGAGTRQNSQQDSYLRRHLLGGEVAVRGVHGGEPVRAPDRPRPLHGCLQQTVFCGSYLHRPSSEIMSKAITRLEDRLNRLSEDAKPDRTCLQRGHSEGSQAASGRTNRRELSEPAAVKTRSLGAAASDQRSVDRGWRWLQTCEQALVQPRNNVQSDKARQRIEDSWF